MCSAELTQVYSLSWSFPSVFFSSIFFLWASSLPVRLLYRTSILSGFPRCCSEVSSAGPQGFMEETMKGAPAIKIFCLIVSVFFCFCSSLRSRAVMVFFEWRVQSPHCLCTSVPLGFLRDHCTVYLWPILARLQNKLT